jgi:two-component system, NtrC family, sensor histidine kinase KinB
MKTTSHTNIKTVMYFASLLLIAAILIFSFRLVAELRETTRKQLTVTVERYSELLKADDPSPALQTIKHIEFPIILADDKGEPLFWKNVPIASDNRSEAAIEKLKEYIRDYDREGNRPIPLELSTGITHYFHYADDSLIYQIQMLTWLGIGAAVILVLIGYYGFSTVRASEERAMWIGIARETAHQLGTPISGLMGWLELLRTKYTNEPALEEMENDVNRLRGVVARFSAIGKEEKLIDADLATTVHDSVEYARKRLPRVARNISIVCEASESVIVKMRPELIDWVLENLYRNAAEAIETGDGVITVKVYKERSRGVVTVNDNGKGMTKTERRNAFRAGYSTKRKGWGVGLSLSKRIIEEEHNGSLSISTTGKSGTTFRLELPLRENA